MPCPPVLKDTLFRKQIKHKFALLGSVAVPSGCQGSRCLASRALPAVQFYRREALHGRMEAALSVGAGEEDTLMAVVEPRQASVPDRLLIALLHAGVSPEALQQRYGVSADELIALKAR